MLLTGTLIAEVALTGAFVWSPLVAALLIIALSPSREDVRNREQQLVEETIARLEAQMVDKLPCTPKEPTAWLNYLMKDMWRPYLEPFLLRENLGLWQDKISYNAPKGWDIQLVDMTLGTGEGLKMDNIQAFKDTESQRVAAIDFDIKMASPATRVVVQGRGPLGEFTATISDLQVSGLGRLIPILEQRIMLFSFRHPPDIGLRLQVKGPVIGERDVPQFSFIKNIISALIQENLVDPRRVCISLDYEILVQEAVDTMLNVTIESIQGLVGGGNDRALPSLGRSPGNARTSNRRIVVRAVNVDTKVKRATAARPLQNGGANMMEVLKISLGNKEAAVRLEVRDERSSDLLGSVLLHVMAGKDGSTVFWTLGREDKPMARRWGTSDKPWRVCLPLEGAPGAEITLALAVDPWVYKQPLAAPVYRSTGPRTVILQLVEGRDLAARDWAGTSDPYVLVRYNQQSYRSPVIYNTLQPVWKHTFSFPENSSPLTRRVRLEVWDSVNSNTALRDDLLGFAVVNLDTATENTIQDRWYLLAGDDSGEVRVRYVVVPGGVDSPAVHQMLHYFESSLNNASTATLQVDVVRARALMPPGARVDAYCNILYSGVRHVSPVVRGSIRPRWQYSVVFSLAPNVREPLQIQVRDMELLPPDDILGEVELDVMAKVPAPGATWEGWVDLKGKTNEAAVYLNITHFGPSVALGLLNPQLPSTTSSPATTTLPGVTPQDTPQVDLVSHDDDRGLLTTRPPPSTSVQETPGREDKMEHKIREVVSHQVAAAGASLSELQEHARARGHQMVNQAGHVLKQWWSAMLPHQSADTQEADSKPKSLPAARTDADKVEVAPAQHVPPPSEGVPSVPVEDTATTRRGPTGPGAPGQGFQGSEWWKQLNDARSPSLLARLKVTLPRSQYVTDVFGQGAGRSGMISSRSSTSMFEDKEQTVGATPGEDEPTPAKAEAAVMEGSSTSEEHLSVPTPEGVAGSPSPGSSSGSRGVPLSIKGAMKDVLESREGVPVSDDGQVESRGTHTSDEGDISRGSSKGKSDDGGVIREGSFTAAEGLNSRLEGSRNGGIEANKPHVRDLGGQNVAVGPPARDGSPYGQVPQTEGSRQVLGQRGGG